MTLPACHPDPRPRHPVARWLALSVAVAAGASMAGPLVDPTRPPTAAAAPSTRMAAPARAAAPPAPAPRPAASAAAAGGALPAIVALPRLLAIQIPQQGPASALVDGRILRLGDSLAGATVVEIDHDGLLLRQAGGTRRLWLLDAVTRPGDMPTALAQAPAPAASAPLVALPASTAGARPRSPIASWIGKTP